MSEKEEGKKKLTVTKSTDAEKKKEEKPKEEKKKVSRFACVIPPDVAEQYKRAAAMNGMKPSELITKILCDTMTTMIAERKGKLFPELPEVPGLTTIAPDILAERAEKAEGEILRQKDMADALGISNATLNAWRKSGCPHMKLNVGKGAVYYVKADVVTWVREQSKQK